MTDIEWKWTGQRWVAARVWRSEGPEGAKIEGGFLRSVTTFPGVALLDEELLYLTDD